MKLEEIPVVVHIRYPRNVFGLRSKLLRLTPRGRILDLTLSVLKKKFSRIYLFSEFGDITFSSLRTASEDGFPGHAGKYVNGLLDVPSLKRLAEKEWDCFLVLRAEDVFPPLEDLESLADELDITLPDAVRLAPSWLRLPPLFFESSAFLDGLSRVKVDFSKDIFEEVFNFLSARTSKYRVETRFQKGILGWFKLNLSAYAERDMRTVSNVLSGGGYSDPEGIIRAFLEDPQFYFHVPFYYRIRYLQWGSSVPELIASLKRDAFSLNDEVYFIFEDFPAQPLVRVLSSLNGVPLRDGFVFRSFWEIGDSVFEELLERYPGVFRMSDVEFLVRYSGKDLSYELNSLMKGSLAPVHLLVSADEVGDEALLSLYRKYASILRKVPNRYFTIRSSYPQPFPRFPCWEALRGAFFQTVSDGGGALKMLTCPVGEEVGNYPDIPLDKLVFSEKIFSFKSRQLSRDFSFCPPECHLWFRAAF